MGHVMKNLSSVRSCSNKPAQLQRLKFRTTNALIRLRGSEGWSAPLLFSCNNKVRFSHVEAHIAHVHTTHTKTYHILTNKHTVHKLAQNSITFVENSVDPDQLA